jgi:photosystem II stability/assembly factor-like uncharacterized protein
LLVAGASAAPQPARTQDQAPGADTGQPTILAPLATKSLLLALAVAGDGLVAVGERGHVLRSTDHGRSWTQSAAVPTRAMLTGVCFEDARRGWAVGHDEIILATADGGATWTRAHFAPESQQPLLDVACGPDGHAIAVGAYGSVYTTSDGVGWSARKLGAQPLVPAKAPVAAAAGETAPDYHLNRIARLGQRLYIAAEAGHLYRSDDGGATWLELPSPYEGSFYGLLALDADSVLAFGLRGRLFRSRDAGRTWQPLDSHTVAMLTDAARLADGTLVVVGLSGVVLVSRDAGETFALQQQPNRKGLAAVAAGEGSRVVVAGEGGVRLVDIGSGRAP